jgi:SAM-dependent methyltransferase
VEYDAKRTASWPLSRTAAAVAEQDRRIEERPAVLCALLLSEPRARRSEAAGEGGGQVTEVRYIFDNAAERQARERFAALPRLYDLGTFRHLEALGVTDGWRCLEVGAGGGSVARWLAERVGPTGRVLATDVDTRFLEGLAGPNLEVRRHDVTADPLSEAAFDLAHARLVLVHLPEREAVLARLVAALKPGGWLLVEEFDSLSMRPDPALNPTERRPRVFEAMYRVMAERGVDLCFGRVLPGRLRAHGLVEVDAEGRVFLVQAGSPWATLLKANLEQLRAPICAAEGLTAQEFDRELAYLDDPGLMNPSSVMWTAWGRRP